VRKSACEREISQVADVALQCVLSACKLCSRASSTIIRFLVSHSAHIVRHLVISSVAGGLPSLLRSRQDVLLALALSSTSITAAKKAGLLLSSPLLVFLFFASLISSCRVLGLVRRREMTWRLLEPRRAPEISLAPVVPPGNCPSDTLTAMSACIPTQYLAVLANGRETH